MANCFSQWLTVLHLQSCAGVSELRLNVQILTQGFQYFVRSVTKSVPMKLQLKMYTFYSLTHTANKYSVGTSQKTHSAFIRKTYR